MELLREPSFRTREIINNHPYPNRVPNDLLVAFAILSGSTTEEPKYGPHNKLNWETHFDYYN